MEFTDMSDTYVIKTVDTHKIRDDLGKQKTYPVTFAWTF